MTATRKHLDEARQGAVALLESVVSDCAQRHAALVFDLFGRVSLFVWLGDGVESELAALFAEACGEYWTGTLVVSRAPHPEQEQDLIAVTAWRDGIALDANPRARVTDRFRHHTAWRGSTADVMPLWSRKEGPPIVVFHAFKGGAGRTTALAGYALACARRGEHVSVVDVDLDAPGVGRLLAADADGTTARWGTVDFLLESAAQHPIQDYIHVLARPELTGEGRLEVMPAGLLNEAYLPKLARVDPEVHGSPDQHPLAKLLLALRERGTRRILLDGRAGLSPAAGLLLSGMAHLHVLVATSNAQSLAGLERIVHHLGYDAARRGRPQAECVVVQAMVPESRSAAEPARQAFAAALEAIFREGYYASEPDEDDAIWSLADLESRVAPHVPVPISYRVALAHYRSIDDIAHILLDDPEHVALHTRIDESLAPQPEDVDG